MHLIIVVIPTKMKIVVHFLLIHSVLVVLESTFLALLIISLRALVLALAAFDMSFFTMACHNFFLFANKDSVVGAFLALEPFPPAAVEGVDGPSPDKLSASAPAGFWTEKTTQPTITCITPKVLCGKRHDNYMYDRNNMKFNIFTTSSLTNFNCTSMRTTKPSSASASSII